MGVVLRGPFDCGVHDGTVNPFAQDDRVLMVREEMVLRMTGLWGGVEQVRRFAGLLSGLFFFWCGGA
jgi:hypothetical protein